MNKNAAINIANAKKSTGPRTSEGKSKSRLNALRHGLSGRTVVLPTEDLDAYKQFSKEIVDSLHPETPVERQLAQTIADCQWRLNRVRSIEDGMLALGNEDSPESPSRSDLENTLHAARAFRDCSQSFVNLSIYEHRLGRQLDRALRQLEELQTKRKTEYKIDMNGAVDLHKQHKMLDLPWNPADDGFVFSRAQVEGEANRRDRDFLAGEASTVGFARKRYLEKIGRFNEYLKDNS